MLCFQIFELVLGIRRAVVWMAIHLLEYEILVIEILLVLPDNTPMYGVLMLPASVSYVTCRPDNIQVWLIFQHLVIFKPILLPSLCACCCGEGEGQAKRPVMRTMACA